MPKGHARLERADRLRQHVAVDPELVLAVGDPVAGVIAPVPADMAFGKKLGISATPVFFVNGQFLNGAQPLSAFEPLIEAARR